MPLPRTFLLVAVVATVGCASGPGELSDDDREAIAAADVAVVGTDSLDFEPDRIEAEAGAVTIALTCEQGVNHNLVIGEDIVAVCGRGETVTGTVDLDAGTHEFVCTVPGHSQRMRGTLEVS